MRDTVGEGEEVKEVKHFNVSRDEDDDLKLAIRFKYGKKLTFAFLPEHLARVFHKRLGELLE